jgi:hypothetical protein
MVYSVAGPGSGSHGINHWPQGLMWYTQTVQLDKNDFIENLLLIQQELHCILCGWSRCRLTGLASRTCMVYSVPFLLCGQVQLLAHAVTFALYYVA